MYDAYTSMWNKTDVIFLFAGIVVGSSKVVKTKKGRKPKVVENASYIIRRMNEAASG